MPRCRGSAHDRFHTGDFPERGWQRHHLNCFVGPALPFPEALWASSIEDPVACAACNVCSRNLNNSIEDQGQRFEVNWVVPEVFAAWAFSHSLQASHRPTVPISSLSAGSATLHDGHGCLASTSQQGLRVIYRPVETCVTTFITVEHSLHFPPMQNQCQACLPESKRRYFSAITELQELTPSSEKPGRRFKSGVAWLQTACFAASRVAGYSAHFADQAVPSKVGLAPCLGSGKHSRTLSLSSKWRM